MLTLLLVTGCGNILDKVTKKQPNDTQPTMANQANNAQPNQQSDQQETQDITLKDLQVALKDAKGVKLVAQDTGQSLVLNEARREVLIKFLADTGELKETDELAQIVAAPQFPAYQLQIDDNLKVNIYDEFRLGFGGENSQHYYMEKGEVWKGFQRWLPPIAYTENALGYMFKASKVTIKGGSFSEETDVTPYRNSLLRTIRAVEFHSAPLPKDAGEPLTLTFTVSGKNHTVEIYDGYLTFKNETYTFSPGTQAIENLLAQS